MLLSIVDRCSEQAWDKVYKAGGTSLMLPSKIQESFTFGQAWMIGNISIHLHHKIWRHHQCPMSLQSSSMSQKTMSALYVLRIPSTLACSPATMLQSADPV